MAGADVAMVAAPCPARAAALASVPPLRACELCMHGRADAATGERICVNRVVREVHGLRPVRLVRAVDGLCGLGARLMEMPGWEGMTV